MQWLGALVVDSTARTHDYWYPHFCSIVDAVDMDRTTLVGGRPFGAPVLDRASTAGHGAFKVSQYGSTWIACREIEELARTFTGVRFERLAFGGR